MSEDKEIFYFRWRKAPTFQKWEEPAGTVTYSQAACNWVKWKIQNASKHEKLLWTQKYGFCESGPVRVEYSTTGKHTRPVIIKILKTGM